MLRDDRAPSSRLPGPALLLQVVVRAPRTASRRVPLRQRYGLRWAAADNVLDIHRSGSNAHDFVAAVDDFAFAGNEYIIAL